MTVLKTRNCDTGAFVKPDVIIVLKKENAESLLGAKGKR